jgi:hypothetical protein
MPITRTTIAAIVGAIAYLVSVFGFNVPAEVQTAIVVITMFVIGIFAGDNNPDTSRKI